jgi:hypothetical protein
MPLSFRSTLSSLICLLLPALLIVSYANAQSFSSVGVGSLAEPLFCQTATTLQDGTILIAGGTNINYFDAGPNATNHAEIYNPATKMFTPTGSMNIARSCGFSATLLNDGTVLIVGGSTDSAPLQAEIYVPSSGTFSLQTPPTITSTGTLTQGLPIGSLTAPRNNATATLLQDGTVLIAGGDNGLHAGSKSAEIYNPATGKFTATSGSMSTQRNYQTGTLLPNGTVLIAGGEGNISGETSWSTVEIYTPSTQKFTPTGSMTAARAFHTATLLTDGTVLLVGGEGNSGYLSSAEIYTPSTGSFAATGAMNSSRANHAAIALADGTVLVTGGGNQNSVLSTAEIYTPSTKAFAPTGSMTEPRQFFSATLLFNGDVLIAGGEDSNTSDFSSAELYSYNVTTVTMTPAYKVASIIYAPPGNKSQDGFTNTTTNATTTNIGSSFSQGTTTSIGVGFKLGGIGITASAMFGVTDTPSNSTAFQESFTNSSGTANQSNTSAPDAINHSNDLFLIWLNPQVTVFGNESAPVGYGIGTQPLANGDTATPDIIPVSAAAMEANSAGITSVPTPKLGQQKTEQGWMPGLASVCKNLIQSEYNPPSGPPSTCGLQDQCGCTPADFLPILQTDPLLFSQGLSNPVNPYPGTTSPLELNASSSEICGALPNPNLTGSNCRYVPVPQTKGSSSQADPLLTGPDTQGGDNSPDAFVQGENTQTTTTLGGQTQTSVGFGVRLNFGLTGGGSGSGGASINWGLSDRMTWTDSQSIGTASGSGVSLSVSLSSGTVGCSENIPIFEDTVYHTFVFQELADGSCTTIPPAFSISTTPHNPELAALSLGHSISYTVDVSALYGFNGTVSLSASGLPAGVTASFSPASVTTSSLGTATLTLTAAYSSSTHIGTSTVTVTGTSGGTTQSTVFPLTTRPLQYNGSCGVQ